MCFSAQASFISGGILSAIGVYTIYKTTKVSLIPFACIPLLFGLQQLSEGFIWNSLSGSNSIFQQQTRNQIYLFFSETLWPILIPLAVLAIETDKKRKKYLEILCILGIGIGLYFAYIVSLGASSQIVNYHILYHIQVTDWFGLVAGGLYVVATVGAILTSSNHLIQKRGYLLFGSSLITFIFYQDCFISVRCFFAALLSICVYKIVILLNKDHEIPHKLMIQYSI